jgi:uncharacterized membrane protein YbhN (UPF0104 family)
LDQPDRAGRGSRPTRRRLAIQILLAVAVVALVYLVLLPKLVDVGEVWTTLRAMTWLELVTLLAAAVWNLVSYLLPQLVALPGLTPRQAMIESHTSTAVSNLLPAGQAVGLGVTYRFYSSYGFPPSHIARSLLIQGVWNNFLKLGMPIVAVGLLVLTRHAAGGVDAGGADRRCRLWRCVGWIRADAVQRAACRADRCGACRGGLAAATPGRSEGRLSWAEGAVRFRGDVIALLQPRWHWLTLTTLVSHLSLFLVLLLALRHVGVAESQVSWIEVLAAFSLVRLLSAFPITPGGLGVVELGLAAVLVVAGGDKAKVVAAVLVFRALTFLLPMPVGALTYWLWRRGEGRRGSRNS